MGNWCGYAAVPPGHPLHGHGLDDADIEVHGGLTYASECHGEICHVPEPGEPDDVWWFGFDCAHFDDLVPAIDARLKSYRDKLDLALEDWRRYRDLAYVRAETESLAEQLAASSHV